MGEYAGLCKFLNLALPDRDFDMELMITHCLSHVLALVAKHASDDVDYLRLHFEALMLRLLLEPNPDHAFPGWQAAEGEDFAPAERVQSPNPLDLRSFFGRGE